jgi:hypothetical protein
MWWFLANFSSNVHGPEFQNGVRHAAWEYVCSQDGLMKLRLYPQVFALEACSFADSGSHPNDTRRDS